MNVESGVMVAEFLEYHKPGHLRICGDGGIEPKHWYQSSLGALVCLRLNFPFKWWSQKSRHSSINPICEKKVLFLIIIFYCGVKKRLILALNYSLTFQKKTYGRHNFISFGVTLLKFRVFWLAPQLKSTNQKPPK